MKKIFSILTVFMFLGSILNAQSPNLNSSISKLQAEYLQLISQKDHANGYAGLTSGTLILPGEIFPGWAAYSGSGPTIWVSESGTLTPVLFASDAGGLTTNGIRIGNISSSGTSSVGPYGIESLSTTPLTLEAGSYNQIFIASGQTIGGAAPSTGYLWSIGPTGTFQLAGGQFTGTVDLAQNPLTDVLTLSGSSLLINLATSTITTSTGNLILATTSTSAGVIIPSTASLSNSTFALNAVTGNKIFGSLTGSNNWTGPQTFTGLVTVSASNFPISAISGLQSALNSFLPLSGGTAIMTGSLNMGGNAIGNIANPVANYDAVNLNYLKNTFIPTTNLIDSVTAIASSGTLPPLYVAWTDSNSITLSMLQVTGTTNGWLNYTDWTTFNGKQNALTSGTPIQIVGNTIFMPQASSSQSGYLSASDWIVFNGKSSNFTFSSPLVLSSGTVSLPASGSGTNGYLTGTDWNTFNNKQSTISISGGGGGITISGGAISFTQAGTVSNGWLSSTDWNTFNNKSGNVSAPLVSSSGVISLPAAGSGTDGYLTAAEWSTFNNKLVAVSAPLISSSGIVSLPPAGSGTSGYLTADEWSAFSNKQNVILGAVISGSLVSGSTTVNSPLLSSWQYPFIVMTGTGVPGPIPNVYVAFSSTTAIITGTTGDNRTFDLHIIYGY